MRNKNTNSRFTVLSEKNIHKYHYYHITIVCIVNLISIAAIINILSLWIFIDYNSPSFLSLLGRESLAKGTWCDTKVKIPWNLKAKLSNLVKATVVVRGPTISIKLSRTRLACMRWQNTLRLAYTRWENTLRGKGKLEILWTKWYSH